MGAMKCTHLSATAGTMSSFSSTLMASATGCSAPQGLARLGPRRNWKGPKARRSNQMKTITMSRTKAMMAIPKRAR